MNIIVQSLTEQDRTQWEALYRGYAEFYKVPMNEDILNTVWSWIFDKDNAFYCFLAKTDEGKAVGLMHCRAMASPLRGAMVGFLDDLFIDPDHRGIGTAQLMYQALADFGKGQAWPFVRWITADNNYRGRGSYDKIADKTHWVTYQMATDTQEVC
jgi:GNAT superfamily N-acetyltransferase